MKRKRKPFWSILLVAAMVVGLLPTAVLAAGTKEVDYVDANGIVQSIEATVIDDGTTLLNSGWYVVEGNMSTENLTINGSVNLILADGSKLTARGSLFNAGIRVGLGHTLIIYAQSAGTGELTATGGNIGAGIGGDGFSSGGTVTITGGIVTAFGGGWSAGIGGGDSGSGGTVTITGGIVTAFGGDRAAGIGGGDSGSGGTVTITGGTVTANGGGFAAGIGGGNHGSGGTVTITGGTVTANGGGFAAGIGGGSGGSGGTVTITGGTVTANGGGFAAGIGGGSGGSGGTVTITGGTVIATGGIFAVGIGVGSDGSGGINTFTGGSIRAVPRVENAPTNGTEVVYLTTITLPSDMANKPVEYNVNQGATFSVGTDDSGKLYLWLPVGETTLTIADYTAPTPVIYQAQGTVTAGNNQFTAVIPSPPTLAGPATMTLPEGYAATSTGEYSIAGTEPVTVSKTSGDAGITWNDATKKLDIAAGLPAGTYPVTLKASNGSSPDAVFSFTLTISVVNATISPTSASYDLAVPVDPQTFITWNSANTVTEVVYGGNVLLPDSDYTLSGDQLTIKSDYLAQRGLVKGDVLPLEIIFDKGASASFSVNVEDSYIPSANARLSELTLNGSPVSEFDPETTEYDVELPYGSTSVVVEAVPEDAHARVVIVQAQGVPGEAAVSVTAEDNQTVKVYTVRMTEGAAPRYSITVQTEGNGTAGASVTTAAEGETITLSATADSGYRFKEWQVGDGGVSIADNRFAMPNRAVKVTAVFEPIPVAVYAVDVQGSHAAISGAGSYAEGETVRIDAGSRSGYTFSGWRSAGGVTFANAAAAATSFIMPGHAVTLTAEWTTSDSGTSGGSGTGAEDTSTLTPAAPVYTAEIKVTDAKDGTATIHKLPVKPDAQGNTAVLDVAGVPRLIPEEGTTFITMPTISGITAYTLEIPVAALSTNTGQGRLTIVTGQGSVTLPSNMLKGAEGTKADISIGAADRSRLSEQKRAAIGDRPAVQLALAIDGKPLEWNQPAALATVSIPHTPTAKELSYPEAIVAEHIDGKGHTAIVPNGHYDAATGAVLIKASQFGYYAVGYNPVSYTDVPPAAWYSKAVSFIAARGLAPGNGGAYRPDAGMGRGEFVVMLMKAYGLDPDEDTSHTFADVGKAYYAGYVAAAKRLGIAEGMGDNRFAPERAITRQELFTLLSKAWRRSGMLPSGGSGHSLASFSDMDQTAFWAKDAIAQLVEAGIVGGNGGRLAPAAAATRAEIAQALVNLLTH